MGFGSSPLGLFHFLFTRNVEYTVTKKYRGAVVHAYMNAEKYAGVTGAMTALWKS